jgi:lysine 2,3-aminomutase
MKQWVRELSGALTAGADFAQAGLIAPSEVEIVDGLREVFAAKAPPGYAAAIRRPDASDPVWRTIVPTSAELDVRPEELRDPIGDGPHTPVRGLTHRYPDRVLFKPTHTCAVYCRFCFRRYAVGDPAETLTSEQIEACLAYIARTPAVWEVILSGGDPLVLGAAKLSGIMERLRAIEHVKVLRFHTRVPVVLPSRVDAELVESLGANRRPRKAVYVVTHINHVNEITTEVEDACDRLFAGGAQLLNQTVLLKDINDSPEQMEALLRKLVEIRVKPYYLHHGDLARGTSHFRTTIGAGRELMTALRGRLSGLCQPTYVIDIPGGYGKSPIGPVYAQPNGEAWTIADYEGHLHDYLDLPGEVALPL